MLKPLVFAALLVLLSTVACGGGMSLEDYAEECGEWAEDYGDLFRGTSPGSLSASDLEEALEEWEALSPPGEVKGFHEVKGQLLRAVLEAVEEVGELEDELDDLRDELDDAPRREREEIRDKMDDLRDDQEEVFEDLQDRMDDLTDDYDNELDDLPRRTERDLEDEGCI